MTATLYTPYLTATLNGVAIDTALVRGARVETSFADPVSKGYIRLYGEPDTWAQGDPVTITMGAGYNNVTRFPDGNILQGDNIMTDGGPTFEFVARGPLFAAQRYRNNRPGGRDIFNLTGGPATDEAIAQAVLTIAGVSYTGANIGGTGIVRGSSAPDGYTWRQGESALEYLQRLSKASIGYKVVETIGPAVPRIFRTVTFPEPTGPPDFTLTEGVDMFDGGHMVRETFDTYTAWEVTGFDYGDGLHAVYNRFPDPIPDGTTPYAYSSEMIERGSDADTRGGISCETVLGYLRDSSDGEIVKLSGVVTPRDDLFGPGQVHLIDSAMLGGSRLMTVVSVTVEVDENWFTQTLEYVG